MLEYSRSIPAEQQQRHRAATTASAGAVPGGQQTQDPGLTSGHTTTSWFGSENNLKEPRSRRSGTEIREKLVLDAEELAPRVHTRDGYACIWAEKPWASTDTVLSMLPEQIGAINAYDPSVIVIEPGFGNH